MRREFSSEEVALIVDQLLQSFANDQMSRIAIAAFLIESAHAAHRIAPSAWSFSVSEGYLRLNVGQAEAITVYPSGVLIFLRADISDAEYRGLPVVATNHKTGSTPQCAFDGTAHEFINSKDVLRPSHNAYIDAAAHALSGRPRRGSVHKTLYSEAVAAKLRNVVRTTGGSDHSSSRDDFTEGDRYSVLQDRFERNPAARAKCLDHHGYDCTVCGLNFETAYGEIGRHYIQVHHLRVISAGNRYTDPIRDLVPVCANCHAMLHREEPPITIDLLKLRIATK